ncbi:MAG TPA: hypothetical protein VGF15_03055 [Solirubrobacteraceae bacterium]
MIGAFKPDTNALLRRLDPINEDDMGHLTDPLSTSALLEQITATSRPARRSRAGKLPAPRALLGVGAAVATLGVLALLAALGGVGRTPTAGAVTFRTAASGQIIATVTNPFAAQAQLDAAFARQGLEIRVNLIPVSPSIVGTVLYVGESGAGDQIKALQGGHCLMGGGGCFIGIEIPKGFTGEGSITLGRPARPGESYESSASIFAPGEPLHCSGLLGARVAGALPVLRAERLTVLQWREDVQDPSGLSSHSRTDTQPPLQNYIWGAELTQPGKVKVTTASAPWPNDPGAGSAFNKGC